VSLKGKSVVITGATRGIGKATATHLATEGARVSVVGRSVERGERVVADITASGGTAEFIRCDVSVEDDVSSLFDDVVRRHGSIDVVVNNAAATDLATRDRPVVEQKTEDFDHFVRTCLYSVFWSFKYGIPAMGPAGGAFVTISSIQALVASAAQPSYAAAKAAAIALSRQVAVDYGDKGVRANVLVLGWIETNASAPLLEDPVIGTAVRGATGGRPATALDVALAVAFLGAEDGRGFNGATLVLDRGMTALSHVPDLRREA
jgi:3-oxoacyl-[acyl-carrier protein] reductase